MTQKDCIKEVKKLSLKKDDMLVVYFKPSADVYSVNALGNKLFEIIENEFIMVPHEMFQLEKLTEHELEKLIDKLLMIRGRKYVRDNNKSNSTRRQKSN